MQKDPHDALFEAVFGQPDNASGILPPNDELRARVESCTDLELLDRWTLAAATARSLDDVFSS